MLSSLNKENAREATEAAARSIRGYPGDFGGRGIVIPAGGPRYFPSAYVSICMLRELGCRLPIELWHHGSRELDEPMRALMEPLHVRCIDVSRVSPGPCSRRPGPGAGWELKAFAVIRTRFRQVLLLDADNLAVADPTFLFDAEPFLRHGAVFWPDYGRFGPDHPAWRLTGVQYRDEPEFESGQLLVDKLKCWAPLLLAGWMNENSDFWYRYILGDKDTFHLAWRKLRRDYAMPQRPIESLDGVMCQHDFAGERLFQHHNFHKWSVDAVPLAIDGFIHLDRCFSHLAELRSRWTNRATRPYSETSATVVEREAGREIGRRSWLFSRSGAEPRIVRCLSDGRIEPAAREEQTWNVVHNGFGASIVFSGHEGVSCRMVGADGLWRGRRHGRFTGIASLEPIAAGAPKAAASEQPPIRPEDIRIAITTIPRRPDYVHATLASLFASGAETHRVAGVDLFIGAPDGGYLDSLRHHRSISLHPMLEADIQRCAEWGVHRKACLNYYRCLKAPLRGLRGLCICEDDVAFADDFIARLLEAVQEMEHECGLRRYLLACYVPYRLDDPGLRRGKHFRSYPAHSFYGAQCVYYPATVVDELAQRILEDGVLSYRNPLDMIVKEYGAQINGVYGTPRSLAQHIGRHSTGLGDFHASPTFGAL